MPSKSKQKGSGYEREVAKYLSGIYNETFMRNISGSGAFIGGKNSFRKSTLTESQIRHSKGDVVPPESFPKFNAEVKFYADLAFHLLMSECAQLEAWLDQLMTVADPDDVSILFMKLNRKGQYVAVQASLPWSHDCSHARYASPKHGNWMIYSLENFFLSNTENLKSFCK